MERFKIVDLTLPFSFERYAFLMPVHDDTVNLNAVIKPFQWNVSCSNFKHHIRICTKPLVIEISILLFYLGVAVSGHFGRLCNLCFNDAAKTISGSSLS